MQLSELLSPQTVRVGLPGSDKHSVIEAMIELLADDPSVIDLDEVRRVVFKRETERTTGVGKGLAIPHGKTSAVTGNIGALALTKVPIDFDAMDDKPVRLVFLLVGTPESKSVHVQLLSRISRLMIQEEVRNRMLAARTDKELYRAVMEGEAALLEQ